MKKLIIDPVIMTMLEKRLRKQGTMEGISISISMALPPVIATYSKLNDGNYLLKIDLSK